MPGGGTVMRSAYERLFVAFYGWSLKVDGKKGGYNVYYASLMLSLALPLNVASVVMIVDMLVPHPFLLRVTKISKTWWVLMLAGFAASQYLYFRRGDRYRELIAVYGGSEDGLAKGSYRMLLAYMASSVALVVVLFVVRL
jgi:hypothetical protein